MDPVVSGEPQSYGMTRLLPVSVLDLLGGCLKCRWLLQGPSIPPVLGLLNTGPLTPQVPTSVVMPCGGLNRKKDLPLDPAPTELLATAAHPSGQLGGGHLEGLGAVPAACFCWGTRHGT